uniref:Sm domain-containing protein n=1 Tax=Ornithorhynchus anatinus TaxID=9258 RepID=A0A6I8N3W1_ORNAN
MLFYSFFKSLVGKDVVVELKNDLSICGTLHSVDQYLNIKLTDISVTDPEKYPHMVSLGAGRKLGCPEVVGEGEGKTALPTRPLPCPVVRQELLHPRVGGPLRPAAGRRGGHAAPPGCRPQGGPATEAVTGVPIHLSPSAPSRPATPQGYGPWQELRGWRGVFSFCRVWVYFGNLAGERGMGGYRGEAIPP